MAKGRPTHSDQIKALQESVAALTELVTKVVATPAAVVKPTPVKPAVKVAPKPSGDVLSKLQSRGTGRPVKEESIQVENFGCRWIHPTPRGTTDEKADYLKAAPVYNRRGQQSNKVVYLIPVLADGTCAAASEDLRELMEECRETTQKRYWFRSFVDEEQGVALPPRYTVAIERITDEVNSRIIE